MKTQLKTFDVYWSPEGRKIATVEAKDQHAAIRNAPQPYRKYLGEIYAVRTPNAFKAIITLESDGLLLGGAKFHESSPFKSKTDAEAFGQQSVEVNRNRPGYQNAKIFFEVIPVYSDNPLKVGI